MVLRQVLLQLRVPLGTGLEDELPLLTGTELAVVPEGCGDRPVYLAAGGESALHGGLNQGQRALPRRRRGVHLDKVRNIALGHIAEGSVRRVGGQRRTGGARDTPVHDVSRTQG